MRNEDLTNKLREYVCYLDASLGIHRANANGRNREDSITEDARADSYQKARDIFYEFFPDLKPADYKTLEEEKIEKGFIISVVD